MKPANVIEENPKDDDKHEGMKLFSYKKVTRFTVIESNRYTFPGI